MYFCVSTSGEVCFEVPAEITSYLSCCSCCSFSLRMTAGTCRAPPAAIEGRTELEPFWHPCQLVNTQKSTTQILACRFFLKKKRGSSRRSSSQLRASGQTVVLQLMTEIWFHREQMFHRCWTDSLLCFILKSRGDGDRSGRRRQRSDKHDRGPMCSEVISKLEPGRVCLCTNHQTDGFRKEFLHFDVFAIWVNKGRNTLFPEDAQRYFWRQSRMSQQLYGN